MAARFAPKKYEIADRNQPPAFVTRTGDQQMAEIKMEETRVRLRPARTRARDVRRWLLGLVVVLAAIAAGPAMANAATLEATFGPTLTGSEPLDANAGPGNDTSFEDDVVRTNDVVNYTWAVSVNGGASPNTTITQTLPDGLEWESPLPAFCRADGTPVSSISADDRTIVCNIGPKDSSSGSADQYPVLAKVRGDVAHGTVFESNFTVSSSDPEVPDASPAEPVTVTVSAAPRVNLVKSTPNPSISLGTQAGVWGQFVTYPVSLVVDSENGKGSKGNELLTTPFTFTDEITTTPAGVPFQLVGCGPNGGHISGIPNGNGGANNSATNSGTPVCGLSGSDISFEVPANADLTGEHVPNRTSAGGTVPANRAYLATYYIRMFVANTDIVAAGDTVRFDNVYEGFEVDSISGQPNVEPIEDNVQAIDLEATDPSPGTTNLSKWFNPSGNENSNVWDQNRHIYPETTFWGMVRLSTGGHLPIAAGSVAICDMFDNTTYHLTLEGQTGPDPARPAWVTGNAAGTGANAVIEYGTGGVRGHDPDGWGTGSGPGARGDDCADASSPAGWEENPSDLGVALDEVTKVRVRYLAEIPAGNGNVSTLHLNFKSRNIGMGETDPLPTGTILANFAKISRNQDTGTPTWSGNNYNPQNISGSIGRRLFLTRGDVRLSKNTDPENQASALSGDVITYRIKSTATGEHIPGGVMPDVIVRDTLDSHLDYVPGSGQPIPTQVIDNLDGTTTLVWDLGDRPINEPIGDITYDARIDLTTPNNLDVVNRAIISSPEDASADGVRSDQHEIRVTQKAGILIQKTTSTPWVEPGDQLAFQIQYVNNSVTGLDDMESIDVLPYNGDDRGSDFNGTIELASVLVNDGELVRYTSREPSAVSDNPKDPSNGPGGATQWCAESELGTVAGCPGNLGESTAVRVIHSEPVPRFASHTYDIVLNTEGNHSADVYGNDAGLATQDTRVLLTAYSPVVEDRVVASALGDYVWVDSNRNGIQDAGERPVAGVTVNLTGINKHDRQVAVTTTTDQEGRYLFPHLVSGEYEIEFVRPEGYAFTVRGAGDPAADSNADPETGATGPITIDTPIPLQEDQEDLTWDAGIFALPTTVTIVKVADPADGTPFAFDTTAGLAPGGQFELRDGEGAGSDRATFEVPGDGTTHSVTERVHEGWTLTGLECVGTAATETSPGDRRASITAEPGGTATCTFRNRKDQVVVVPPVHTKKPKPRIRLKKAGNKRVAEAGERVRYRISIRNTRKRSVAKNVRVCDRLPRHMTVVDSGTARLDAGRLCWRIPRLAYSKRPRVLTYVLKIDSGVNPGTKLKNVVMAAGKRDTHTVRVKRSPDSGAANRPGGVTG